MERDPASMQTPSQTTANEEGEHRDDYAVVGLAWPEVLPPTGAVMCTSTPILAFLSCLSSWA